MLEQDHSTSDCLVIGAGLSGLATAFELARAGFKTTIIYNPDDLIYATKATHGISTIKGILESDAELFGLKLMGHRGFSGWLSEVEAVVGSPRHAQAWRAGVVESFQTIKDFQNEFGRIYRKDFVGAKQVQWLESGTNDFAKVLYPGDWWIDPEYLIKTLWKSLEMLGVAKLTGIVKSVASDAGGVKIILNDPRELRANHAIVCAGVGTQSIFEESNIDLKESFFAVAGYTFTGLSDVERNFTMVKATSGVTQVGKKVFWGSTSDATLSLQKNTGGECMALRKGKNEMELARTHLAKLCPELFKDEITDIHIRWGVRVRTRSRGPLVNAARTSRKSSIWINSGYYKSGIILSWLMAKRIAKSISAGHPYSSNH